VFYVPFEEDVDEVSPIIARALAQLQDARRDLPSTTGRELIEAAPVDHLADIAAVLRGEKRVRTQIVLARLAEANPVEYEDWTFRDLSALLAEYDIAIGKYGGVKVLRLEDIDDALTGRADDEEVH